MAEDFSYCKCPQCGRANRIDRQRAASHQPVCGQCAAPLSGARRQPPAVLILLGVLVLALPASQWAMPYLGRTAALWSAVLCVWLVLRYYRATFDAAWKVMLTMFGLSVCLLLYDRSPEAGALKLAGIAAIWQAPAGTLRSEPHRDYLAAVDARDAQINVLASQLVRGCATRDQACEADSIARFVADRIDYRNDPDGGRDYIKPPRQTLAAQAGDCEDKTILAVSLLETLGIRSVMAFEPGHVYPMACFDQIPEALQGKAGRQIAGAGNCFALEPTAKNSGLGVEKDASRIEAAYLVKGGQRLD